MSTYNENLRKALVNLSVISNESASIERSLLTLEVELKKLNQDASYRKIRQKEPLYFLNEKLKQEAQVIRTLADTVGSNLEKNIDQAPEWVIMATNLINTGVETYGKALEYIELVRENQNNNPKKIEELNNNKFNQLFGSMVDPKLKSELDRLRRGVEPETAGLLMLEVGARQMESGLKLHQVIARQSAKIVERLPRDESVRNTIAAPNFSTSSASKQVADIHSKASLETIRLGHLNSFLSRYNLYEKINNSISSREKDNKSDLVYDVRVKLLAYMFDVVYRDNKLSFQDKSNLIKGALLAVNRDIAEYSRTSKNKDLSKFVQKAIGDLPSDQASSDLDAIKSFHDYIAKPQNRPELSLGVLTIPGIEREDIDDLMFNVDESSSANGLKEEDELFNRLDASYRLMLEAPYGQAEMKKDVKLVSEMLKQLASDGEELKPLEGALSAKLSGLISASKLLSPPLEPDMDRLKHVLSKQGLNTLNTIEGLKPEDFSVGQFSYNLNNAASAINSGLELYNAIQNFQAYSASHKGRRELLENEFNRMVGGYVDVNQLKSESSNIARRALIVEMAALNQVKAGITLHRRLIDQSQEVINSVRRENSALPSELSSTQKIRIDRQGIRKIKESTFEDSLKFYSRPSAIAEYSKVNSTSSNHTSSDVALRETIASFYKFLYENSSLSMAEKEVMAKGLLLRLQMDSNSKNTRLGKNIFKFITDQVQALSSNLVSNEAALNAYDSYVRQEKKKAKKDSAESMIASPILTGSKQLKDLRSLIEKYDSESKIKSATGESDASQSNKDEIFQRKLLANTFNDLKKHPQRTYTEQVALARGALLNAQQESNRNRAISRGFSSFVSTTLNAIPAANLVSDSAALSAFKAFSSAEKPSLESKIKLLDLDTKEIGSIIYELSQIHEHDLAGKENAGVRPLVQESLRLLKPGISEEVSLVNNVADSVADNLGGEFPVSEVPYLLDRARKLIEQGLILSNKAMQFKEFCRSSVSAKIRGSKFDELFSGMILEPGLRARDLREKLQSFQPEQVSSMIFEAALRQMKAGHKLYDAFSSQSKELKRVLKAEVNAEVSEHFLSLETIDIDALNHANQFALNAYIEKYNSAEKIEAAYKEPSKLLSFPLFKGMRPKERDSREAQRTLISNTFYLMSDPENSHLSAEERASILRGALLAVLVDLNSESTMMFESRLKDFVTRILEELPNVQKVSDENSLARFKAFAEEVGQQRLFGPEILGVKSVSIEQKKLYERITQPQFKGPGFSRNQD